MQRTVTEKLIAKVVGITDLEEFFSGPKFKGRVALDVRIQQGTLTVDKALILSGPTGQEEVRVLGIELLSPPRDPEVIRFHCSKPKSLVLPTGVPEGWVIAGR